MTEQGLCYTQACLGLSWFSTVFRTGWWSLPHFRYKVFECLLWSSLTKSGSHYTTKNCPFVSSFRMSCCATTKKNGNQLENNRLAVHLGHKKYTQVDSIVKKENINIMVFPPNHSGHWILLIIPLSFSWEKSLILSSRGTLEAIT